MQLRLSPDLIRPIGRSVLSAISFWPGSTNQRPGVASARRSVSLLMSYILVFPGSNFDDQRMAAFGEASPIRDKPFSIPTTYRTIARATVIHGGTLSPASRSVRGKISLILSNLQPNIYALGLSGTISVGRRQVKILAVYALRGSQSDVTVGANRMILVFTLS